MKFKSLFLYLTTSNQTTILLKRKLFIGVNPYKLLYLFPLNPDNSDEIYVETDRSIVVLLNQLIIMSEKFVKTYKLCSIIRRNKKIKIIIKF